MRPRRTLRTQLTLLYAVPFLASGALLLLPPLSQTRPGPAGPVFPGPTPGAPPAEFRMQQVLIASALGLAAMAVVAVVLGWLVAGRFLRPLRAITATARDISATNLHRRLGRPGRRNDEFTELAATLDDLFARLEAAFAAQRRFVANASHELRTPLTAERTLLQVALADPDATADTLRAACRDVLALGEAQARLIDALLTLASGDRGVDRPEPFDLAAIARDAVESRAAAAREHGVTVGTALRPAPSTGDPSLVESLVTNLVDNAIRHNVPGGRVSVTVSTLDGRAAVAVRNTGPVVPPGEVDRLFQPFQRLAGQRLQHTDGHGLGLAIVRAIAGAHAATIQVDAPPEGGLDVRVTFPA